MSIITATVFWLFNRLNKEYDASVDYPVTWAFDANEYIVVDKLPSSIRMNVKGIGWVLVRAYFGLRVKPITINLPNPVAYKNILGVSLTNRIADDLEDLQLNYILDDTLHLNIDKRSVRSFAVYIDSANISLNENYRIVSPVRYDTQRVEIEGPELLLNKNDSGKFVVKIPDTNIRSDYEEDIDFTLERSELFRFNPQSVRVSFEVAEFTKANRLVVLQRSGFPEDSSAYLADTLCTVEFIVRSDLEESIVADSFLVSADYSRTNRNDTTLLLKLIKVPPQVLEAKIKEPQVKVMHNE